MYISVKMLIWIAYHSYNQILKWYLIILANQMIIFVKDFDRIDVKYHWSKFLLLKINNNLFKIISKDIN